MSDADVSDSTAPESTMKGQSRLIVIMANSQTVRESAKKLSSHGKMVRVGRGVFLLHGQIIKDQSGLQDLPTISFQKSREIPSSGDRGEEAASKRVYAVVSYGFKSPTATQKKRVERLVRKSASIRLRPGVLLFPVFRSKERRRLLEPDGKHILMDSRRISEELRGLGAEVSRWSRLRLVGHPSELHEAVARTLSYDFSSFETLAKDLHAQAKGHETQNKTLKKRYSILSKRYGELKFKWGRAGKIWNHDATKSLTRAYNIMLSVRRIIDSLSF
ncbi:MAG: hypothetical protein ACW98J_00155 [Candidatus Thorarchaeota archaeon]